MWSRSDRWLGVALVAAVPGFWGCSNDSTPVSPPADASSSDGASPPSDAATSDVTARDADASVDSTVSEASAETGADADGGGAAAAAAVADAVADSVSDAVSDAPPACAIDGGPPSDLASTGLYSDWATKTVAPNVLSYTPSYLLWSDGAQKSRWIYLPPGSQIDTTDMDNWVFPVGTKIWKEFSLGGKIIETRLIWKTCDRWNLLVYRWSADGVSSTTLLANGETNVNGTTYEIPATFQCHLCHDGRNDLVLGFDLIGLGASGAVGVTLADLVAQGRLTRPPPANVITIPEDATLKAAAALGYMHMNCGVTCHNAIAPGGSTRLYLKLLASQLYPPDGGAASVAQLDSYKTSVGVSGILQTQYMRIAPKDAGASLITLRAGARDGDAGPGPFGPMPPIITHQVDTVGLGTLQAWINAL